NGGYQGGKAKDYADLMFAIFTKEDRRDLEEAYQVKLLIRPILSAYYNQLELLYQNSGAEYTYFFNGKPTPTLALMLKTQGFNFQDEFTEI
ncbi:hypothetical protein ABTN75_19985, partial [Acinetobacter baumannii]